MAKGDGQPMAPSHLEEVIALDQEFQEDFNGADHFEIVGPTHEFIEEVKFCRSEF